jgi:hypothetical protein
MRKCVYFDVFDGPGWPAPRELERYFLGPPGQRWTFRGRNDCWGLNVKASMVLSTCQRRAEGASIFT